jgi:hypothetical protein
LRQQAAWTFDFSSRHIKNSRKPFLLRFSAPEGGDRNVKDWGADKAIHLRLEKNTPIIQNDAYCEDVLESG